MFALNLTDAQLMKVGKSLRIDGLLIGICSNLNIHYCSVLPYTLNLKALNFYSQEIMMVSLAVQQIQF